MVGNLDLEAQYDKIYRYCYFKLGNRETAEDITQETFLRFLERGYESSALQFLYTIARNLCIDEYRKKKPLPLPALGEGAEEHTAKGYEMSAGDKPGPGGAIGRENTAGGENSMEERLITVMGVREALKTLEERERELVLLRYVNEVPVGVIAKMLGISRFSVYRLTKGALEHLKENLRREGFGFP